MAGFTDGNPDDLVAGDVRAIEQPALASLHTLFLNEHNRLAAELKSCLPSVLHTDEILYQETRRIVGAELQNIVYSEFLPLILGSADMDNYGLTLSDSSVYNPTEDPSVLNEFATVAYRFGHSLIPDNFVDSGNSPEHLKDRFNEFESTVTCPRQASAG